MGRPYEALRFANSVRRELGLKPAKRLLTGTNPVVSTISANAKSVTATYNNGLVVATRGKDLIVDREVPAGALDFIEAATRGEYPQYV